MFRKPEIGHLEKLPSKSFLPDRGFFVSFRDGQLSIGSIESSEAIGHRDYYLEFIAKSRGVAKESVKSCRLMYVYGETESLDGVYKVVRCGKDYCLECGQSGSDVHLRRISRWWDKVMSMKSVGYLVVTMPPEIVSEHQDVDLLKKFANYWVEKMKSMGFSRGLARWHWFGDGGKGYVFGQEKKWHPHLNLLFESGYLGDDIVQKLKDDYKRWILLCFGVRVDVVDVNYSYKVGFGKKFHILKYVTRATMTFYDIFYADLLHGFRNSRVWGSWKDVKVRRERDIMNAIDDMLEKEGGCMKDMESVREIVDLAEIECEGKFKGQKINWLGVRRGAIPKYAKPLGAGYFVCIFEDRLKHEKKL